MNKGGFVWGFTKPCFLSGEGAVVFRKGGRYVTDIKEYTEKDRAEISLLAKTAHWEEVLEFVNHHLEAHQCDEMAKLQLDIAVEELFVNVANYAYYPEDGMIWIQMFFKDDMVTIVFMDEGVPYNPLEREDPDITLSAEERKVGGLGVYMVKMSMDHVEYAYRDNKNILTIQKKIQEDV